MASIARINTLGQVQYPPARPVAKYPVVISAAAVLVLASVWLPDALYYALSPLGGEYDMTVALWLMIICLPLITVLTASAGSVLWARNRHVGEYGHLNDALGARATVLAAACAVVEHIALYAVIIAAMVTVAVAQWPVLHQARRPISVALALVLALPSVLGMRRLTRVGAIVTAVGAAVLSFLTGALMGSTPYFRTTTTTEELTNLSQQVSQQSESFWQIILALLGAFTIALTPALLVRYVNLDLRAFAAPRSRYGAITTMAMVLAGSGLIILTLINIGDVEAERFISRHGALISAARWLHLPSWVLTAIVLILLSIAVVAARTVLHDGAQLNRELAYGHMLPHSDTKDTYVASAVPWYAVAAATLVAVAGSRVEYVLPALVISGFGSFALTRLASWRYWNQQLRVEGHSQRRKSMKKARLLALIGFAISSLVVVAFALSDLTRAAWLAVAAISVLYVILYAVRRYYLTYGTSTVEEPIEVTKIPANVHYLVVAPTVGPLVERTAQWVKAAHPASAELVHLDQGGDDAEEVLQQWRERGLELPMTLLAANGSHQGDALIDHIRRLRRSRKRTVINVVIPCVIFSRPIHSLLHNREVEYLQRRCQREDGVMVTIVPWLADAKDESRQ
ncbi:MAG: hypothetical protein Q4P06_01625 [Actinomycetaceae bacterium]|nr:hypothetical protein [Actinomycetaceae bacterium]